ncbi:dihydrofolate reductase family protein [Corynebacterium sp. UBA2622]|uniref:dihydrofolate reductase family protein n=1 Tax=Corynebacterium sp. UBA2622 TaxID=1946393 RepID=UPI0025B9E5FF|nr:dihydrofolate reductase family protein [Corynebacterium sp. UBA2622]
MDIASLIGPTLPPRHPEVRAIMATTMFGAFTRDGTSGPLGNRTDSALLSGLRDWAGCILVGAETVRREGYGRSPTPLAVLSSSLNLDPASDLFGGSVTVLCPERALHDASLAARRDALSAAGARLVSVGSGSAPEILDALRRLGHARISCEGGPGVYSSMLAAGLVDVVHVTVDPSISATDGSWGLELAGVTPFHHRYRIEAAEVDGGAMLFCRYRRVRP